jgi:hypothetical protein
VSRQTFIAFGLPTLDGHVLLPPGAAIDDAGGAGSRAKGIRDGGLDMPGWDHPRRLRDPGGFQAMPGAPRRVRMGKPATRPARQRRQASGGDKKDELNRLPAQGGRAVERKSAKTEWNGLPSGSTGRGTPASRHITGISIGARWPGSRGAEGHTSAEPVHKDS